MYYAAIHLIGFKGFKTVKRFTEKYFLQILLKNVGFIGKKTEQGVREMICSCSAKNLKVTVHCANISQIFSFVRSS